MKHRTSGAWLSAVITASFVSGFASPARAAESAQSLFLGGGHGPVAGVTPPPGIYFQNSVYLYDGNASANRKFQLGGGNLALGIKGNAALNVPTFIVVTPMQILGGSLGFTVTAPFGGVSTSANTLISGPFGLLHKNASVSDSATTFGDPIVGALIGWHAGNFHWQVAESVNVPIGDYREGALVNVALHRWVGDTTVAGTWLDPAIGLDVSGAAGFAVNGNNPVTHYRTGTEFHVEASIMKYLSKEFSIGPAGYFYQQLTGDSGAGDKIGSFKGRVAALGGALSYSFAVGKTPVSTSVRVYREFDVTNRIEGTAGWVSVSMPLTMLK